MVLIKKYSLRISSGFSPSSQKSNEKYAVSVYKSTGFSGKEQNSAYSGYNSTRTGNLLQSLISGISSNLPVRLDTDQGCNHKFSNA